MKPSEWSMGTAVQFGTDVLRAVVLGLEFGWPAMRAKHGWKPSAEMVTLLAQLRAELHRREHDDTTPDRDVVYITAAEAAGRAGVSSVAVRKWFHEGKVHGRKVNNRLLVDSDDVDDMIACRAAVNDVRCS